MCAEFSAQYGSLGAAQWCPELTADWIPDVAAILFTEFSAKCGSLSAAQWCPELTADWIPNVAAILFAECTSVGATKQ